MTNQIWIYYGKIENLVKEESSKQKRERTAGRLLLLNAIKKSNIQTIQNLEELEQSIEIGAHGKPYFKDKTRFPFLISAIPETMQSVQWQLVKSELISKKYNLTVQGF